MLSGRESREELAGQDIYSLAAEVMSLVQQAPGRVGENRRRVHKGKQLAKLPLTHFCFNGAQTFILHGT